MTALLSLVICTYNPNPNRLQRVIDALVGQTMMSPQHYEIILVDNRSDPPVTSLGLNLSKSNVRVVSEIVPGLTAARLRGYRESRAPLIVFVDDDNILSADYANIAILLADRHPEIGVFSSGCISPEYGISPPDEIRTFWPYMALIDVENSRWSSSPMDNVLPIGAGMLVRREVLERYALLTESDVARATTDRQGENLFAGGDTDIGLVACEMGLACGYFPELKLVHVMPAERLTRNYLRQLAKDVSYSTTLVVGRAGLYPVNARRLISNAANALLLAIFARGKRNAARRIVARSRLRAHYHLWANG